MVEAASYFDMVDWQETFVEPPFTKYISDSVLSEYSLPGKKKILNFSLRFLGIPGNMNYSFIHVFRKSISKYQQKYPSGEIVWALCKFWQLFVKEVFFGYYVKKLYQMREHFLISNDENF